MTNPIPAIKKYLYTAIGTATSLTVYDGIAPDDAGNEYIVLTGRSGTPMQGKTGFASNVTMTIDIVTRGQFTGYKRSEDIAQLILTDIDSNTNITLSTGQATSLYLANITNLDGLIPFRKIDSAIGYATAASSNCLADLLPDRFCVFILYVPANPFCLTQSIIANNISSNVPPPLPLNCIAYVAYF